MLQLSDIRLLEGNFQIRSTCRRPNGSGFIYGRSTSTWPNYWAFYLGVLNGHVCHVNYFVGEVLSLHEHWSNISSTLNFRNVITRQEAPHTYWNCVCLHFLPLSSVLHGKVNFAADQPLHRSPCAVQAMSTHDVRSIHWRTPYACKYESLKQCAWLTRTIRPVLLACAMQCHHRM